jgi:hypothetical protein
MQEIHQILSSKGEKDIKRLLLEPLAILLQQTDTPDAILAAKILKIPEDSWENIVAQTHFSKGLMKENDKFWKRHLDLLLESDILNSVNVKEYIEPYFLALDPIMTVQVLLNKLKQPDVHSLTISTASRLLRKILKKNSLLEMHIRSSQDWEYWITLVFSIPSKLSNVLHSGNAWFDSDVFFTEIASQLFKLVQELSPEEMDCAKVVVAKMMRLNLAHLFVPRLAENLDEKWKVLEDLSSFESEKFVEGWLLCMDPTIVRYSPRFAPILFNRHILAKPLPPKTSFQVLDVLCAEESVWSMIEKVGQWLIQDITISLETHFRHTCILLHLLTKLDVDASAVDSFLADVVPPHLASTTRVIHQRGMVLAEEFSRVAAKWRKSSEVLKFDVEETQEVITLRKIVHQTPVKNLEGEVPKEAQEKQKPVEEGVSHEDDLQPFDLESSDSSGEETRIKAPRYILELIDYLSASDDVEKQKAGIKALDVVQRLTKAELEDFGETLVLLLLRLQNDYDLPRFEESQKTALGVLLEKAVETGVKSVISAFIKPIYERNRTLSMRILLLEVITTFLSADVVKKQARTPADLGRVKTEPMQTRRFASAPPPTAISDPLSKYGMGEALVSTLIGLVGYTGNQWDPIREMTRENGDKDGATLVLTLLIKAATSGIWRCRNLPAVRGMATIVWELCFDLRFLTPNGSLLTTIMMAMLIVLSLKESVVATEQVEIVGEWMWSIVQDGTNEQKELAMEVIKGLKQV